MTVIKKLHALGLSALLAGTMVACATPPQEGGAVLALPKAQGGAV